MLLIEFELWRCAELYWINHNSTGTSDFTIPSFIYSALLKKNGVMQVFLPLICILYGAIFSVWFLKTMVLIRMH